MNIAVTRHRRGQRRHLYRHSEIDVQKALTEKLGADFRPYVIREACNPPLAHLALETELDLGLLLPCNVVVDASVHGSRVAVMDPAPVVGLVGNPVKEREDCVRRSGNERT